MCVCVCVCVCVKLSKSPNSFSVGYCASYYSADVFTILSTSRSDFHFKVLGSIHIFTDKPSF